MERTIRVTGKGKITVKPDTIRLRLSMEGIYPEYDETLQKSSEIVELLKDLVEKQETLTQFLMMTADVDQETAEDDARKMMHFISKKSFQGIRNFIKQVEELN